MWHSTSWMPRLHLSHEKNSVDFPTVQGSSCSYDSEQANEIVVRSSYKRCNQTNEIARDHSLNITKKVLSSH